MVHQQIVAVMVFHLQDILSIVEDIAQVEKVEAMEQLEKNLVPVVLLL